MPKKVIFLTGMYQPEVEAISKEISYLTEKVESFVYSRGSFPILKLGRKYLAYWNRLSFLDLLLRPISNRYDICHIYHVFSNMFFLKKLRDRPVIFTGCSEISDVFGLADRLKSCSSVVVQSLSMKTRLIEARVPQEKLKVIYPGYPENHFYYQSPSASSFCILFASAPLFAENYFSRGVHLLLDFLSHTELDIKFIFLWRDRCNAKVLEHQSSALKLINKRIKNMNQMYGKVHATIAPFAKVDGNKSCPNSIVESIMAGKPVLVSNLVGIADVIKKYECGVAFDPEPRSLGDAISELISNYSHYQANCQKCASENFRFDVFCGKYLQLYDSVTA